MNIVSIKNENKGTDFFTKETLFRKFHESHDFIHKGFTLITGENNENKRGFINNMLVGSCGKNPTIFLDTRRFIDDNSLDLISSHRFVVGEVKRIDIYKDGLPVNVFAMDPNKSKEENAIDLFDIQSCSQGLI